MNAPSEAPWLVVIDMQTIFADPTSAWAAPRYAGAATTIQRMLAPFGERTVFTRFVPPTAPAGAWIRYYQQWPFALVPADDPLYAITSEFDPAGHPIVSRSTFGKWGDELDRVTGHSRELVLVGVSTDCCVISTALAAADAGVHVRVATDGCAGASDPDHQRALEAMDLYAPLIELTTADAVLSSLP